MHRRGPIAVDIFAGAGGLAEGFLAAGIDVAVAVEHHPHAALTNSFNHPNCTVVCGDINELNGDFILSEVKKQTGKKVVDIVAGGPPCQGFSSAGKQDQKDPRNKLVHEFVRIVGEVSPKCFVFENVPAIVEASGGRVVKQLIEEFWDLGFQIQGIDNATSLSPELFPIVDSSWFGVPQARKRLILVGWKRGLERFEWLNKSNSIPISRRAKTVTVFEAIGDLDFLKSGYECHSYMKAPSSHYQVSRRANSRILLNHLASAHRKETLEMFGRYKPGCTVSSIPIEFRTGKQRIRRFTKTEIAPAILALPDDFIHYSQNRIPTVRELARLQSFDDDFVFLGKRTTSDQNRRVDVPQYTQVGNAVPPLMARSLGRAITKMLGGDWIDRRDRRTRRRRIETLMGSSAFRGYCLCPELMQELQLLDVRGEKLCLKSFAEACSIDCESGPTFWPGNRVKAA